MSLILTNQIMPADTKFNFKQLPVVLVLSVILMLSACNTTDTDVQEPVDQEEVSEETSQEEMEEEESAYVDGEYSADGQYSSPAGAENVSLTVTIEGGVIVDASFEADSEHPTSQKLQQQFQEGFLEEVQGANIDEVDLDVVNGSSLTPKGFNDALEKIKSEARA